MKITILVLLPTVAIATAAPPRLPPIPRTDASYDEKVLLAQERLENGAGHVMREQPHVAFQHGGGTNMRALSGPSYQHGDVYAASFQRGGGIGSKAHISQNCYCDAVCEQNGDCCPGCGGAAPGGPYYGGAAPGSPTNGGGGGGGGVVPPFGNPPGCDCLTTCGYQGTCCQQCLSYTDPGTPVPGDVYTHCTMGPPLPSGIMYYVCPSLLGLQLPCIKDIANMSPLPNCVTPGVYITECTAPLSYGQVCSYLENSVTQNHELCVLPANHC